MISFFSSGTHIDAPYHFSETGLKVDQLVITKLIGHCRLIDVKEQANLNRNYAISVDDIVSYEALYGPLSEGDIVVFRYLILLQVAILKTFLRTGWHQYWSGGPSAYLGFDEVQQGPYDPDSSMLSFPGIGDNAAQYLVSKQIAGVGIDTASLDPGNCINFLAHRMLLGNGIYGIENLNENIEHIPPIGSCLYAIPLKIGGGTGSPSRVFVTLCDKR